MVGFVSYVLFARYCLVAWYGLADSFHMFGLVFVKTLTQTQFNPYPPPQLKAMPTQHHHISTVSLQIFKFRKDPSFRRGDIPLFVAVYDLELETLLFSNP